MSLAPQLLARAVWPVVERLCRTGERFDLIDAHYYYPDGVAAALLARRFARPLVISARGSDLNVLGGYPIARRLMRWAAGQAQASVGVSAALVSILRRWGVAPERLYVMRNGVDLQRFMPSDRREARVRLGLSGDPLLLSVGNLVDLKGHDLAIEALALLSATRPGAQLCIVGDGPLRDSLQEQARECGVESRVHFAGRVPNEQLAAWYSAADAMVLASRSEGWANVLLESMACGTPVVATAVGGSAEVVAEACAGRLVARRDAPSLVDAVEQLLADPPDRRAVRAYAERFGWQATTDAQLQLFRRLVAQPC
jgi:glycosyltransferase involved in cell wall biosynthesis